MRPRPRSPDDANLFRFCYKKFRRPRAKIDTLTVNDTAGNAGNALIGELGQSMTNWNTNANVWGPGVVRDRGLANIAASSVQEASQRLASVALGLLGHAGVRHLVKAMIGPRIHVKLDRHPGAAQPVRVDHVFFEEKIETAD